MKGQGVVGVGGREAVGARVLFFLAGRRRQTLARTLGGFGIGGA